MSSRYVRTMVRNWMNQGSVPFYDTVNVSVNPPDDMWATIDWGMPTRAVETYCRDTLEEGVVNVIFFGLAGIGDDILLQQAEAAMDFLMSKTDTSGRLVLLERGVPIDFRQEEYFCLEFQVSYEYRA